MTRFTSRIRFTVPAALGVLVVVFLGARWVRESTSRVPEPVAPATASASATAPAPATASAPAPATAPAPAPASAPATASAPAPASPLNPVYLRIDALTPTRAGAPVRGHLRANINAAYYDFPMGPGDAGTTWLEVGAPVKGQRHVIPRSSEYEAFFELELRGGEGMSGTAETLNLTSPGGRLSDKLPFHEEYKLYFTGHGMKAPEPSAILSYTITETP